MALRGHGDDSQYHQKIGGYSTTHVVNFIDLLNYGVCQGDKVLAEHLKKSNLCLQNQSK